MYIMLNTYTQRRIVPRHLFEGAVAHHHDDGAAEQRPDQQQRRWRRHKTVGEHQNIIT
jgi:hypothetical protein